ncbi:exported hypothetical protein [Candidatus Sulfopaludibacter sp. SbA4]|nr:exported hypothetical protein [Candidatus Sulfopaludibacter sp. SbA4]
MIKTLPLGFLLLALLPGGAWAQLIQNSDFFFLFGPRSIPSQVVPGTNATVYGATLLGDSVGYGYQVARRSAASLWLEYVPAFAVHGISTASIPGSVDNSFNAFTLGVRIMIPVQSRISVYGALGGGGGWFHYAVVASDPSPNVTSNSTAHGVFDFGGGVDFRLSRHWSIRGEVRDFVSGAGLSGSTGVHHLLPVAGVALHF